jgi:phosphoglycerate kinase
MNKATVDDIDVAGKRVLVRVDFNVPMRDGKIVDDRRIREAIPTVRSLQERGAKVILLTHLGRPKGKSDPSLSTRPLAEHLSSLLGKEVKFAGDVAGDEARKMADSLPEGGVGMVENVRFEGGEEQNDEELAKRLASLADLYCNDAFGTAHRAHASTEGVAHHLPAVAGRLMARELETLGGVLESPRHPVVAIIGGAKISSKLGVVTNLLSRVDTLWVGGAMACTFYAALGEGVGRSLVEPEFTTTAAQLFNQARQQQSDLRLPPDVVVAAEASAGAPTKTVSWKEIPNDEMVVDVGQETVSEIAASCRDAATIVWNGPLVIYEIEEFGAGTRGVAEAVGESSATSIVGGGDLAAALEHAGVSDRISHMSTGGGATLEFLEGKALPGVAALRDGVAVS